MIKIRMVVILFSSIILLGFASCSLNDNSKITDISQIDMDLEKYTEVYVLDTEQGGSVLLNSEQKTFFIGDGLLSSNLTCGTYKYRNGRKEIELKVLSGGDDIYVFDVIAEGLQFNADKSEGTPLNVKDGMIYIKQ